MQVLLINDMSVVMRAEGALMANELMQLVRAHRLRMCGVQRRAIA